MSDYLKIIYHRIKTKVLKKRVMRDKIKQVKKYKDTDLIAQCHCH